MAKKVELTDKQYQEILKNINKNSDIVNKEEFKEAVSEKKERENPELSSDDIKELMGTFLKHINTLVQSQKDLYDQLKNSGASQKELAEQSRKLDGAEKSYKQIKDLISGLIGDEGEEKKGEATAKALAKDFTPAFVSKTITAFSNGPLGVIQSLLGVISKGVSTLNAGVKDAMQLSSTYLGRIDARLNGLQEGNVQYYSYFKDIAGQFNTSQYISQKELTQNMAKLVEQGIARDVEQRAILETIKDKVVTTFDSMNASLTRLVRIQQENTTGLRMGSEAELTKFFNRTFQDTSYLTSLYDTVNSIILDAEASLGNSAKSVEFNYAVQKWLGSMYSAGVSDSSITNIAQGLNALATGNIGQLSDSSVGNLFALSAREAGLSYTDLLTEGLNASNVSALLKSMVMYLQQIAGQTTGNVAKSAIYNAIGGGVSFADIQALNNLDPSILASISTPLSASGMNTALQENIGLLTGRTTAAERVQNLKDNILLGFGKYILGEDETSGEGLMRYAMWNLSDYFGVFGDLFKAAWAVPYATDIIPKMFGDFGDFYQKEDYYDRAIQEGNMGALSEYQDYLNKKHSGEFKVAGQQTLSTIFQLLGLDASNAYERDFSSYVRPGSVSSGISSSYSEQDAYGRNYSQNQPTATAQTGYAGASKTIGDLYAELFENQQHPIRVSIAQVEDKAQADIGIGPNGLKVDVNDTDTNSIVNAVSSIRMAF